MTVELVRARTTDGMSLDGALNEPPDDAPAIACDGALLLHGVGSNFYQPRLLQDLAEGLAARGVRSIRANTLVRGSSIPSNRESSPSRSRPS